MNIIQRTITIYAPVHTVFEYIREPDNLRKMCPNLMAVQEVQRLPGGSSSFQWAFRMAGTRFRGTGKTTECDVDRCLVSQIEGGMTGTVTWFFRPENEGTHLSLVVEYAVPLPLIHKPHVGLIISANELAVTSMLENLKITMEEVSGHNVNVIEAKIV
jgi:uncharacterized protein YndB with AHSA1/START domain